MKDKQPKLTDKDKLEAIKPLYEDVLQKHQQQGTEINQLKSDLQMTLKRIEELLKNNTELSQELTKARIVVGAEYLKGVQL